MSKSVYREPRAWLVTIGTFLFVVLWCDLDTEKEKKEIREEIAILENKIAKLKGNKGLGTLSSDQQDMTADRNKDVCVRCWQGNIRKPIRRPISCSKKQDSRIVACKDSSELEPNKEKEETFPTDKSFSIEEANAWYEKEPYPGYHRDMERLGMTPSKQDGPKVGGAKNLYKPDGTPYAPWLIGKVVEDTVNIKFRKKPSVSGKLAADPQLQETSGVGLKARLLGDEVELSWTTEDEGNNVGFVIQRRKGGTEEFQVVCDYRTTPSLRSKGESGGTYSYLDSNVSPGTWIYRLSDINAQGDRNDLSQTLIDIPSNEDKKKQQLALVILLALIISLFVMGLLFDPVGRT